jgi:hypothetical protein
MYRTLFNLVKRRIPRISDTEMIALQSGDTSVDRAILQGRTDYPMAFDGNIHKFDENNTNQLLRSFDGSRIYPNDNDNLWVQRLAATNYPSMSCLICSPKLRV